MEWSRCSYGRHCWKSSKFILVMIVDTRYLGREIQVDVKKNRERRKSKHKEREKGRLAQREWDTIGEGRKRERVLHSARDGNYTCREHRVVEWGSMEIERWYCVPITRVSWI